MKNKFLKLASVVALAIVLVPSLAFAGKTTTTNSLIGVQGYDLVSYQDGEPTRGNGHNVSVHDNVTYTFANAENKAKFDKNPDKFLPEFGGYCAYGVAVGKKFVGDPNVWKVVEGKLYLNLDKNVQKLWEKDEAAKISEAHANWKDIKHKSPSDL